MRKPLIAVLHRDTRVRSALISLLNQKGYEAAPFSSVLETYPFIQFQKPDLVLIDRPGTPSQSVELLERIKALSYATEVVFLPSPLTRAGEGSGLRLDQVRGLLHIVERLLHTVPLDLVLEKIEG